MAAIRSEEKEAHWRGVLAHWRESGLSGAAFCRGNDVSLCQFHYWRRRIAEIDESAGGGFAKVTVRGSGVHLILAGGLRLEVEPGFDEATLKRFLRAASEAC